MATKRKAYGNELQWTSVWTGDTDLYVETSNKILKLEDEINKKRSSGAFKKSAVGKSKRRKKQIECSEELKIAQISQRQKCERLNCFVMEKILNKVNVIDRIPLENVSKTLRQISLNGFRFRGISLKIVEQERFSFRFLNAKRNLVTKNWSELSKMLAIIFSRAQKIEKLELCVLNMAFFTSAFLKALERQNSNELRRFKSFSLKLNYSQFPVSGQNRKMFNWNWQLIEKFGHLFEILKLNFSFPLFNEDNEMALDLFNIVSGKCKKLHKITYRDKDADYNSRIAIEFDRYRNILLKNEHCVTGILDLELLVFARGSSCNSPEKHILPFLWVA